MIKTLLTCILVTCGALAPHEYYVTITEAEYNPESGAMEVLIKFTGHDLEHALEERGAPELYLGTTREEPDAEEYLMAYIEKGFTISVDGEALYFELIGKEVTNEDFIYVYIEAKDVPEFTSVSIRNTLLTEYFGQQSNIIHFTKGEANISFTLTKDHPEETHEIEE